MDHRVVNYINDEGVLVGNNKNNIAGVSDFVWGLEHLAWNHGFHRHEWRPEYEFGSSKKEVDVVYDKQFGGFIDNNGLVYK